MPGRTCCLSFFSQQKPVFFPREFGFSFGFKHCVSLGFEHASSWFCFIPWSQIAKPLTYCIHRFGNPCFLGFSLVWLWTNWTVCGIGIAMGLQSMSTNKRQRSGSLCQEVLMDNAEKEHNCGFFLRTPYGYKSVFFHPFSFIVPVVHTKWFTQGRLELFIVRGSQCHGPV